MGQQLTKRGEFRITAGWSRHADESGRWHSASCERRRTTHIGRGCLPSCARTLSPRTAALSLSAVSFAPREPSRSAHRPSPEHCALLAARQCAPVRASPPGSRSLPVPSRLPLHNSKVGMLTVSPLSPRASSPCLLHAPSVPMVARCIQCHTSQLAAHQRARARHSAESVNRLLGDRTAWGVAISHELLLHPVVVGAVLTAADELNEVLVMGNDHELGGGEGGGHRATR